MRLSLALSPLSVSLALAQLPASAYDVIKSQPDLTFITKLVERDPYLKNYYSTAKDVTVVAAIDSSFPPTADINKIPFSDQNLVRDVQLNCVIKGVYPAASFLPKPKWVQTALTPANVQDSIFGPVDINTSWGSAVLKLYARGTDKTVRSYSGTDSNIYQPDLKFQGGLVHKLASPIGDQKTLNSTAFFINNYALTNASRLGLLDELNTKKDLTLFTITNDAWNALVAGRHERANYIDIIKYHVIKPPGLYYGNRFNGQNVQTLQGGTVKLSTVGPNQFKVNDVNVANPDVFVQNGVVHILEKPLTPP